MHKSYFWYSHSRMFEACKGRQQKVTKNGLYVYLFVYSLALK